jgi:hypothetical protein
LARRVRAAVRVRVRLLQRSARHAERLEAVEARAKVALVRVLHDPVQAVVLVRVRHPVHDRRNPMREPNRGNCKPPWLRKPLLFQRAFTTEVAGTLLHLHHFTG